MELFQRLLAQFRTYWAGLSRVRQVFIATATAIAVLAIGSFGYFSYSGNTVPLYAEPQSPEEISKIVAKLKSLNKYYELDPRVGIKVPEKSWYEYHVALAGEGIPAGAGKGWDLWDETNSLTSTPFGDKVRYQRAIQVELAHAISKYPGVRSAQVMIAQPDQSSFYRPKSERDQPRASVLVVLRPGAEISKKLASIISRHVAFALPGLKPENVSVSDTNGHEWQETPQSQEGGPSPQQIEYRKTIENDLKEKVEHLLAAKLGKNRVIVTVTADLDFKRVKDRTNRVIPEEKGIEREMQRELKSTGGSSGGIAGATPNIRQTSGTSGRGGGTLSETASQTETKYSHLVRDTDDQNTLIQRLSIAAIVDLAPHSVPDGQPPPVPISTKDVEDLIKNATNFKEGRDQIKVTNTSLPVSAVPSTDVDEETAAIQRLAAYVSLARNLSLAVAVVMAISLIPLLLLRRRAKLTAAAVAAATTAANQQEQRQQERIQRLVELARTDPDRTAALFGLMVGTPSA